MNPSERFVVEHRATEASAVRGAVQAVEYPAAHGPISYQQKNSNTVQQRRKHRPSSSLHAGPLVIILSPKAVFILFYFIVFAYFLIFLFGYSRPQVSTVLNNEESTQSEIRRAFELVELEMFKLLAYDPFLRFKR